MATHDNKISYNHGLKRRCGPIKPEKVLELSIPVEYANCGNLEMNVLYFVGETTRCTEQKLKLSIFQVREQLLNLLNEETTKKHPDTTPACSKRGTRRGRTYNQTLELRRGGKGQRRGPTQLTQQFYQPPQAWS